MKFDHKDCAPFVRAFPLQWINLPFELACASCRWRSTSISIIPWSILSHRWVLSIIFTIRNLFHNGIKRVTGGTLNAQKVPLSLMRLRFAIVTHNVDYTLQISGHGLFGNIPGACFPGGSHTLLTYHCLFANRATIVKASELSETMSMNRVTTGQILRTLSRRKHVFSTDRTIVLVFILKAIVRVKYINGNTHTAFLTMAETLDTTNPTEAAFRTMERFLWSRHP